MLNALNIKIIKYCSPVFLLNVVCHNKLQKAILALFNCKINSKKLQVCIFFQNSCNWHFDDSVKAHK